MWRPTKVVIAIFALLPPLTFADHGSGTVEILCDEEKDTLTISTYIKWNEDYDSFIEENPSGSLVSKEKAVFTLNHIKDVVNYNCSLKKNSFTVRISRSTLFVLTSAGKTIYEYYDIYPSGESIYGLSSPIDEYYLKTASDGKLIECVSRNRGKVICEPYAIKR